jgi:hypothetical protein
LRADFPELFISGPQEVFWPNPFVALPGNSRKADFPEIVALPRADNNSVWRDGLAYSAQIRINAPVMALVAFPSTMNASAATPFVVPKNAAEFEHS